MKSKNGFYSGYSHGLKKMANGFKLNLVDWLSFYFNRHISHCMVPSLSPLSVVRSLVRKPISVPPNLLIAHHLVCISRVDEIQQVDPIDLVSLKVAHMSKKLSVPLT